MLIILDALPIGLAQERLPFVARNNHRGAFLLHLLPVVLYTDDVVAFHYNPLFFAKNDGLGRVGRYIEQALGQRIRGRPLGNISDTFTIPPLPQAMGYFHRLQLTTPARAHLRKWLSTLAVVFVWISSDNYFLCKARNVIHKEPQQRAFQTLYYNLKQVVAVAAAPGPNYAQ